MILVQNSRNHCCCYRSCCSCFKQVATYRGYDLFQYNRSVILEHARGKYKAILLPESLSEAYLTNLLFPEHPTRKQITARCFSSVPFTILSVKGEQEGFCPARTLGLAQWKLRWKHVRVQSETMTSKQNQCKTTGIKSKWGPQLSQLKSLSKKRFPHSPFDDCSNSGNIYRLLLISAPLLY